MPRKIPLFLKEKKTKKNKDKWDTSKRNYGNRESRIRGD